MNRPELQVSIPEALKAKLIDDWEHIILRGEVSDECICLERPRGLFSLAVMMHFIRH